MLKPSMDDIKRFERKVYLLCAAGLVAGASILVYSWSKQTTLAIILDVVGIVLAVTGFIMLMFFMDFFYKLKKRINAGEDPFRFERKKEDKS